MISYGFKTKIKEGLLYDMGIGLVFSTGAPNDGTDVLGRIIQIKFPHIPIGQLLLAVV